MKKLLLAVFAAAVLCSAQAQAAVTYTITFYKDAATPIGTVQQTTLDWANAFDAAGAAGYLEQMTGTGTPLQHTWAGQSCPSNAHLVDPTNTTWLTTAPTSYQLVPDGSMYWFYIRPTGCAQAGERNGRVQVTGVDVGTPNSVQSSIWPVEVPLSVTSSVANQMELGTRFSVDVPSNILAIRFYKASGETGTHVGSLWNTSGQLLAQVTFANETASGWQTAALAVPVFLQPGVAYIVSRHKNANNVYPYTSNGLAAAEKFTPPLHAPKNATGAGNGLTSVSTTPVMPATGDGNSYFVDVVVLPGYCGMFQ